MLYINQYQLMFIISCAKKYVEIATPFVSPFYYRLLKQMRKPWWRGRVDIFPPAEQKIPGSNPARVEGF
jgi:hypothetical protein